MMNSGQTFSVLHVATALSWRGGEQQVAYLVEELVKKNVKQFVLCSKDSAMENFCRNKNIPHFVANKRSSFDFSFGLKIKKICEQNQVDIVHVHDSHAHSFAIYAAVAGNKSRIIVSRRVDFAPGKSWLSRYKYNHPSVAKILCVSEVIRKIMAGFVDDPSKVVTVHSGIDITRFSAKMNKGILHREFGLSSNIKIIGNVSALAPHKDFPTFITTASMIKDKFRDVVFFIIGDGPEKQRIESLVHQAKMEKYIYMTGFRNDIADVLPELDLFLMTSETEGLGTTLLDAFACSVPVVATAAGGIPEVVIHNETGLLAVVGDFAGLTEHSLKILNDGSLRKKLTEGALKHLANFSRESTAMKTIHEYHAVKGSAL